MHTLLKQERKAFAIWAARVATIATACVTLTSCAGGSKRLDENKAAELPANNLRTEKPTTLPWIKHPAATPPTERFPKTESYSFKLKGIPALSVVEALSQNEGFSFEGDSCTQQPINLYLKNVSATQAIDHIAQTLDLQVQRTQRHIRLGCNRPYFVTYKVDYPSVERNTVDTVIVNSQLGATIGGAPQPNGQQSPTFAGNTNNNGASLSVQTKHQNHFWNELANSVQALLRDPNESEGPAPITTETTITQQSDGVGLYTDSRGRVRQRDIARGQAALPVNAESTINKKTVTQAGRINNKVITHPESGLLIAYATQKQHRLVEQFLETVNQRSLKQVLIEATVAEVKLSSEFQKGIQWRLLRGDASRLGLTLQSDGEGNRASGINSTSGVGGIKFDPAAGVANNGASPNPVAASGIPSLLVLRYLQPAVGSAIGIGAALSLLESFGEVRVISNPKLAVLNQQTAVMKVVDNRVYFTVQVQTSAPTNNSTAFSTFNTQVHTVPVGFFMAVTPHIEDNHGVSLTVRPTVSRILGFVNDPNPALAQAGVVSRIPEIQTREIESVMRLHSGEIALLGGLMQTTSERGSEGLPGLNQTELGKALTQQERSDSQRTELVVLLRPVVQPVMRSSPWMGQALDGGAQ